jgi:hypothetical protein
MSEYSRISKELGHERRTVTVPSEKDVLKLVEKARQKDVDAFKKLFEIVRFAPSGNKPDDILSINSAYSGYLETKSLFE